MQSISRSRSPAILPVVTDQQLSGPISYTCSFSVIYAKFDCCVAILANEACSAFNVELSFNRLNSS